MSASPPVPDSTEPLTANRPARQQFHLLSYLIGLFTAVLLVGGAVLMLRRPDPPPIEIHPPPTPAPTAVPTATATPGPIVVFVSGAVVEPGMYQLMPGARVGDAITMAGGLAAGADPALVNQATSLYDGAQVHVPEIGMAAVSSAPPAGVSGQSPAITSASTGGTIGGLVNLNAASVEELQTLPGIGPSKASAIVANRPYASVDDLDRVPGIGPSTLNQLRNLVTTQ